MTALLQSLCGVFDRETDLPSAPLQRKCDRSVRRRILDRIVQKDREQLPNGRLVAAHGQQRLNLNLKALFLRMRHRCIRLCRVLCHLGQRKVDHWRLRILLLHS